MPDEAEPPWVDGSRLQVAARASRAIAEAFLTPLSSLIFMRSAPVGVAMWAVLMQTPPLAIAAFLALSSVELLRRPLVRYGISSIAMEIRANVLLGALFTGWLVAPMGLHPMAQILMVAAAVVATLYLGMLGYGVMRGRRFPVGVLPYCVWAAVLLTLFPDAASASIAWFAWSWPAIGSGQDLFLAFLKAAGVFVFSPSSLSGAIIVGAVLLWSPFMFIAGVAGWVSGAILSIGLVQIGVVIDWVPTSYNGFLAGMALGAVFVGPGWKSLSLTPLVGAMTALIAATLQILTDYSGVSYLPVPFMLSLFSGLLAQRVVKGSDLPLPGFETTPEQRRISADWIAARWGKNTGPLLALPVEGPVLVTQGVNGALTHRGSWRHALDFQAPLHGCPGSENASIWGRSVYSPVEGTVVSVRNDVADNLLGDLNYGENWGNFAMLRTSQREHVALCHLEQGSISVHAGQEVDFSTRIGKVGNSGRSSVPHLHLQAQASCRLGAATAPFRIANYLQLSVNPAEEGPRWHAAGLPREGDVVEPGLSVPAMHKLLTGILPGRSMWVANFGTAMPPLSTVTSLTDNGLLHIACRDEGSVDLEYDVDALRVVNLDAPEGSFIAALAVGLSTVPYAAFSGVRWTDSLHVPARGPAGVARRLLSPFLGSPLSWVELSCADIKSDGLWLSAEAKRVGTPDSSKIELTLAPQKGPVRLLYRQGQDFFERNLASFEVHAT